MGRGIPNVGECLLSATIRVEGDWSLEEKEDIGGEGGKEYSQVGGNWEENVPVLHNILQ